MTFLSEFHGKYLLEDVTNLLKMEWNISRTTGRTSLAISIEFRKPFPRDFVGMSDRFIQESPSSCCGDLDEIFKFLGESLLEEAYIKFYENLCRDSVKNVFKIRNKYLRDSMNILYRIP